MMEKVNRSTGKKHRNIGNLQPTGKKIPDPKKCKIKQGQSRIKQKIRGGYNA
jgi:hypothetical protein